MCYQQLLLSSLRVHIKLVIVFWVCVLLTLPPLFSQETSYKNYDINEGLPSSTVYRIDQDKNGTMWFATEKGICSFDGYDFNAITSSTYGNLEMTSMKIDSSDRVWHFNLAGDLFYLEKGKVHSFGNTEINDYKIYSVNTINDKLFITYRKAGQGYKVRGYQLIGREYETTYAKEVYSYPSLIKYGNHLYMSWNDIDSKVIIEKIDSNAGLEKRKHDIKNKKLIRAISEDSFLFTNQIQDSIYFISNDKILDSHKLKYKLNRLVTIDNISYILTHNGMYKLDITSDLKIEIGQKALFNGMKILSFFKDIEGSYWLGTANSGVYYVPNLESIFFNKENSSLSSSIVRTISLSENFGSLYIGLDNGDVFRQKEGEGIELVDRFGFEVNKIVEDIENQKLWIASNEFLSSFSFLDQSKVNSNAVVKDFCFAPNDKLLMAMNIGVMDVDKNQVDINKICISNSRSYAVKVDSKDRYWVGNIAGLYVFEEQEQDSKYKVDTLLNFNVSDIEFVNDSIAFVSTFEAGLFKIHNFKIAEHYSTANLLSSNRISDIYMDSSAVYISTDSGLNILDTRKERIKYITKSDGIISDNINQTIVENNSIWMATDKGLCKIPKKPSEVDLGKNKARINSIAFSNIDTTVLTNYQLESNNRNVSISFSTSSYKLADRSSFFYRLNGLDTSWQRAKDNSVRFSQLPFGKSLFEVYALDRNTGQRTKSNSITFDVDTPLKQRRWFQIFLVLASILLLSSLRSRYLMTKHKREKEKLINQRKITGLKLTALQNHMNPHFISNAILTIQDLYDKKDRWAASQYTSKFAQLVRSSMHLSTMERITLGDEILFLEKYIELEQMRFDQSVKYDIVINDNLKKNIEKIRVPPLLIQPIVENVFKHAGFNNKKNPSMKIIFSGQENYLTCQVLDNGIGLDSAYKKNLFNRKTSTGLATIDKRLKLNAEQLNNFHQSVDLISFTEEKIADINWNSVTIRIYYPT